MGSDGICKYLSSSMRSLILFIQLIHSTKLKTHFSVSPSWTFIVFTARRYASAVLAVILCPSVRPSLRLSVRHKSELYKDG